MVAAASERQRERVPVTRPITSILSHAPKGIPGDGGDAPVDSLYAVIGFGGSKQRKGSDFYAKIITGRGQAQLAGLIERRGKTYNVVGEFPFLLHYGLQDGVIANFVEVRGMNQQPASRMITNCNLVMDAMKVRSPETRERFMDFARVAQPGSEFRSAWPSKSKKISFSPNFAGI